MEPQATTFSVTPAAIDRLNALAKKSPDNKFFRVAIDGGGCAGFRYRYEFTKTKAAEDKTLKCDNITLLIDPTSLELLENAELDYVTNLIGSSFRMNNPNSSLVCGCGVSFSPKV